MSILKKGVKRALVILGFLIRPRFVQRRIDAYFQNAYQKAEQLTDSQMREQRIRSIRQSQRILRLFYKRPDYRIAHLENGIRLTVDVSDSLGLDLYFGAPTSDRLELALLSRLVGPGNVCVDVGANIGLYALTMALAAKTGRVYAFEPSPATYALLEKNVRLNAARNLTLGKEAISEARGTAELVVTAETGLTSLGDTHRGTVVQRVSVPTISLDESMRNHGISSIDFLKIDVEGYEGHVLRGAEAILRASANLTLMIELDDKNFRALGFSRTECLDLLRKLEYRGFLLDRKSQSIVPLEVADTSHGINYVFTRETSPNYKLLKRG